MAQYWFKLLITMLVFVTSTTNTRAFDAYLVAAQWPHAVCRPPTTCKHPQPWGNSFLIHGVWPIDTNSKIRPTTCSSTRVRFDKNNIPKDQREALDRLWPDLTGGDNLVFWEHEWDDHGECSGLIQVDYFWKCLKLWEIGKVDARLSNAGIVTSNVQRLLSTFQSQLAKQMEGVEPIVTCRALAGNKREVKEIRFCFNMTNNFVPCGIGAVDKSCGPAKTTMVFWST